MKKSLILVFIIYLFAGDAFADPWTPFLTNNPSTDHVNGIAIEGNTVWCATGGGAVKWNILSGTYTVYSFSDPYENIIGFGPAAIDWSGTKWFGAGGRIYAYNDTSWFSFTGDNTALLKKWNGPIRSIAVDSVNKRVIFSAYKGVSELSCNLGLLSYNNGKWEELVSIGGSTFFTALSSIAVDIVKPGNIWGSCYQAYLYYFENTDQGYTVSALGGHTLYTSSVAVDRDGNIWVTVPDAGSIVLYDRYKNKLITYSSSITGSFRVPSKVVIDNNSVKWFGATGSLIRYDDKSWSVYTYIIKAESESMSALAVDEHGDVWIGRSYDFNGYGLWRFHLPQTRVNEDSVLPQVIKIIGNSPNPFNPSTTISFLLAVTGKTELAVYSSTGQKVRTLISGDQTAGTHSAVWDGQDDSGKAVSSGVYFSRLTIGNQTATGKMLLLR
ncbi:MAG: FlgD immunoglobulin-like domain containing protein [Candidatus Latescibacter sp.]|nr:FlgD immunoglobulin-like domain containing protein [Candidatus Latescibacter sp.]